MIGFDRPLRPHWIHESLQLAEPGQRLSDLNKPFEMIARELTGKEGKRKVRTVLFRIFLRDEKRSRVRDRLILKELGSKYGQDFMIPIYLFYLIGKTEALYKISEHLFRLYDFGSELNVQFLKEKMINELGERDVVTRATVAFIQTLSYFHVIDSAAHLTILKKKLTLSEDQTMVIIKLFAQEIIRSPQVSLNHLPAPLFNYFELPNIRELAQKYNSVYWDYQHRTNEDLLFIYS